MATVQNLTLYFLQGAIEAFANKLAPINAFSYNINQEGAGLNDIVRVPFVDAQSSASLAFNYATGYATAGDNVIGKNITLDYLYYKRWDVTDQEILRMSPEVLRRLGGNVGSRLAADAVANILGQVTTANYISQSTYSSSLFNSQAAFADLQQICNTLKWPDQRALLVNPSLYGTIVSNSTLVNYAYGNPSVVQEGKLPKYFGFEPYVVTNLPANGELLQGFACNPDAILLGMAYHRPQDEIPYTAKQMLKDEQTGLVLGFRQWGDWSKASVVRVLDVLMGKAVGNASAIVRIKSTP